MLEVLETNVNNHGLTPVVVYNEEDPGIYLDEHIYPESSDEFVRISEESSKFTFLGPMYRQPYNPKINELIHADLQSLVMKELSKSIWPTNFYWIDCYPLTYNGKINKKLLQSKSALPIIVGKSGENISQVLSNYIFDITGLAVGYDDDLFNIGVSSLYLHYFIAYVNENFSLRLQYIDFIKNCTITKLAKYIKFNISEVQSFEKMQS